jgi:hypothetical protein
MSATGHLSAGSPEHTTHLMEALRRVPEQRATRHASKRHFGEGKVAPLVVSLALD